MLLTEHVVPGVCVVSLWLSSPQLVTAGVVLGSSLPRACCELPLPFVSVWSGLRWDFFQKPEQLDNCGKVILPETDFTGLLGRCLSFAVISLANTAGALTNETPGLSWLRFYRRDHPLSGEGASESHS